MTDTYYKLHRYDKIPTTIFTSLLIFSQQIKSFDAEELISSLIQIIIMYVNGMF